MRRLGVHASIAGGLVRSLERAKKLGATTIQIFSHNPRGWTVKEKTPEEMRSFRGLRAAYDITPVFIHTSYLINLASRDRSLREKSVDMVVSEMSIADALGADYVVLHTGSAAGDNPAEARKRAAKALSEVARRGTWTAGLLLENTAGERGDITSQIEEIAEVINKVPPGLIAGVCFDTCHAFSAGYDLRSPQAVKSLASRISSSLERDTIKLIHLNDARGAAGSGSDRHEHIGEGMIGIEGMRNVLSNPIFNEMPIILETPKKSDDDDNRNLEIVRSLLKVLFH